MYINIVHKYKIYLYELLKQVEKQAFLPWFTASANEFYIFKQCMYIHVVFILRCQNASKQLPYCPKRDETSIALIVFYGVLCEVLHF